jgi:hypothetical protein
MLTTHKLIEPSISAQSEAKLSIVAPQDIDGVWFLVEELLLRSYRRSDQSIPFTLREDLRKSHRQLWLITEGDVTIVAAGVTSMFAMRSGLALKIEHLGGGHMREWQHLLKELEAYARSRGCKKLIWEGREGWRRLHPDYRVSAVTMEKRLDADG